jgi:hypothetical protein
MAWQGMALRTTLKMRANHLMKECEGAALAWVDV